MTTPHVVSALQEKRAEVSGVIADLERWIPALVKSEGSPSFRQLSTVVRVRALAAADPIFVERFVRTDFLDVTKARCLILMSALSWYPLPQWVSEQIRPLFEPSLASDDTAPQIGPLHGRESQRQFIEHAADALLQRPQLGRDVFARGAPEMIAPRSKIHADLAELLSAYLEWRLRQDERLSEAS